MSTDARPPPDGVPTVSTPPPAPSPAPPSSSPPSGPATFKFPHYYHFPPMFTMQPNLATRRAQLDKWSALVLAYCRHYRIFRLLAGAPADASSPTAGPVRVDAFSASGSGAVDDDDVPSAAYYAPDLFRNRAIDRALAPADVRQVLDDMRSKGHIEYVDKAEGGACYVYWKTLDEWAAAVEAFVDDTAQRGSVLTLYELTAGDATRGSDLHGLDPAVLQRALALLAKRGKAQIFGQAESLGVKFF